MDHITLLIFLLYGASTVHSFHTVVIKYYFVTTAMTWYDARQYCRDHYTDLATFRNMADVNSVTRPSYSYAWIGLFDDPASWKAVMTNDSNSWRWSATAAPSPSRYMKWSAGNTGGGSGETCVYIIDGGWHDFNCGNQLYFVCYQSVQNSKQFILVQTQLTWKEAQSYCRQHHTDLAMIEDETENSAVTALSPSLHLWIGLYREAWRWSDGTTSTLQNWDKGEPSRFAGEDCGAENSAHHWHDATCTTAFPFICQKAFKNRVVNLQLKLQTRADLSDSRLSTLILAQVLNRFTQKGLSDVKMQWTRKPQILLTE